MILELLKKLGRMFWLLPGFLLWASFPPMGEKTDVLFALAPLMWLSRRADARTSAIRWFMSGMFFWVATMSWMPAIVKNGGPWPLVVLGWVALSAYCAAFFAAYGWLSAQYWGWARNGSYLRRIFGVLMVEPVLWCGLELVRSRFMGGFSWNQLGVIPANGGFGAPASLGGIYLLSAIVILINGTIAGIAERVWKPELSGFPNLKKVGPIETVMAFGMVWGIYQMSGMVGSRIEESHDSIKVAMVQRNFPCVFKDRERNPYEVYEGLLGNFSSMLRPDVVVMAESAMCEFGPVDQQGAVRFASWASEKCGGASVLAGGTRFGDGHEYNSAAIYSGNGDIQIYDKVHLVPFGEFIPGDKWITALQKLAPVGSCTAGELKLLKLKVADREIDVGIAICFEDTDSAQVRKLAAMGAKALFFITNDSWFSRSNEAEQHSWQATARAIETGLPVVRVGNSGVTGTITPEGKAAWIVGPDGRVLTDRSCTMFDRVPVSIQPGKRTLYVTLGDYPLGIAFLLLSIGMILVKYKTHYEKRRTLSM